MSFISSGDARSPSSRRFLAAGSVAAVALLAGGVLIVHAALTLHSTGVSGDSAVNLTGVGTSTIDVGSSTLKLQTIANGPVTFGNGATTIPNASDTNETLSGYLTVASSSTFQGTASFKSTNNNTLYADQFGGADASVQIQACLNALPAAGGTCDARGLIGTQTISSLIIVPPYDTLLLGDATFSTTLLPAIEWNNSASIIGTAMRPNNMPDGTQIFYTGSAASGSLMLAAGASAVGNVTIKNLYLRHTATAAHDGSIGINTLGTDSSLFENISISLFDTDWQLGGGSVGSYYNDFIHSQAGAAYTYDYEFGQNFNQNSLYHPTCGSQPSATETCYHFEASAVNDVLQNPDMESNSGGGGITGIYLNGRANSVYDAYIEQISNPIIIDKNASYDAVIGGVGTSVVDNSPPWNRNVTIAPGAQTTAGNSNSVDGYPTFFASKYFGIANSNTMLGSFTSSNYASFIRVAPINSLSRSSNVVTVSLKSGFNPAEVAGSKVSIIDSTANGATDFNGDFVIAAASSATSFTYNQSAADDTGGDGWAIIEAPAPRASSLILQGNGSQAASAIYEPINSGGGAFYLPRYGFGNFAQYGTITVPYSATPAFNTNVADGFRITLTGNADASSPIYASQDGDVVTFIICQDSSGGHSFTFPSNFLGAPAIGTTANECSSRSWKFFAGTNKAYYVGGADGM